VIYQLFGIFRFQLDGVVFLINSKIKFIQKLSNEALQGILHGRWGVAQGCNCRPILEAIATLIEAQRPDLAMVLIEQELNSQT